MENVSYNHGSNLLAVDEEEAVEKIFHTKNMVCSGYQREMGMMQGIGVSEINGAFLSLVIHSSRGCVSTNSEAIRIIPN